MQALIPQRERENKDKSSLTEERGRMSAKAEKISK